MTATIEAPQIKRQSKSAQMRKYGFFPGCVAKESCKELFNSTMLLADKLGIELVELTAAACCGASVLNDTNGRPVARRRCGGHRPAGRRHDGGRRRPGGAGRLRGRLLRRGEPPDGDGRLRHGRRHGPDPRRPGRGARRHGRPARDRLRLRRGRERGPPSPTPGGWSPPTRTTPWAARPARWADYTGAFTAAGTPAGSNPTAGSDQTTAYAYDGDGNLTSLTAVLPGGAQQQTRYVYGVTTAGGLHDNDLLAQTQYPDPATGAASAGQAQTYAYDNLGGRTTYTDRNGTSHAYTYDALGRLTADAVTAFGTGVDQSVARLGYTYTDAGQLATATSYDPSGNVVNQTSDTYDGFGQIASEAQSVSGAVTPVHAHGRVHVRRRPRRPPDGDDLPQRPGPSATTTPAPSTARSAGSRRSATPRARCGRTATKAWTRR